MRATKRARATGSMTKQENLNVPLMQGLLQPAQAILDTMQLGVTQADAIGEILYANPAVAEMHGYEVEELVGSNVSVFDVSLEGESPPARWSEGSTSWASERVHKRKDGSTLVVRELSDVVSGSAARAGRSSAVRR